MQAWKHRTVQGESGYQNSLYSKTQQLADKSRKLEEKDHIIEEKEKECQKLKDSMSRMLPPEKAELITRLQWDNREQGDKIKALTAQSNMFEFHAKKCKADLEKATDREERNKKLYLEERNRNHDLMEALRPVPQGRSGKVKLPPIVNVPHNQSTEKVNPQKGKVKTVVSEEETVLPPVTNTRKQPVTSPLRPTFQHSPTSP
ncbi:hypothetical protein GBF38_018050 [Nibea albiflora]|uniref:Uncharacterized protein n=1 Tax=Nibea albiflora TaxID=240163 RepID=A0ACB7EGS1_NIBAL|nr:hypothetical protein GBF38_018050 [Nibea albiflora]